LRRLLFIGSTQETSRFWEGGLPKRLQVYRNTVHGNCYDTLDANFPLTRNQFSSDEWFEISQAYYSKHPAQIWELNHTVLSFPKFLKKRKLRAYVPELAEYELTDLFTFVHVAPSTKGMGITNPTLETRLFQHQLFDWISETEGSSSKPPQQKPEVLVFYRDTAYDCHVMKGDPLQLLILDHFRKPGAKLDDLEPARAKLLPENHVPLERVLEELVNGDLVLL